MFVISPCTHATILLVCQVVAELCLDQIEILCTKFFCETVDPEILRFCNIFTEVSKLIGFF